MILQGHRITVTIDRVEFEEVGNDKKEKLVAYFKGKDKGLVVNKTNANMIEEIARTDETDEWPGTKIVLKPARVDFQGKRVDAIRVDYPIGAQPGPAENGNDDASDTVPF